MNKVYRLAWNAALGLWQVAGEFVGRRRGASSGRHGVRFVQRMWTPSRSIACK